MKDRTNTHRSPGAAPPPRWQWARRTRVLALAVFAFSCLLYADTLRNGFVWDDRVLVVDNTAIRTLDGPTVERLFTTHYWAMTGKPGGLYRPLSALSLYVDYQLHGKNPAGFHLTNVLLNGAVCALVFLLLVQFFGARSVALTAALLFASLPLHTENVAWVAGRTDLIATLMMLISLLGYGWWRRGGPWPALALSVLAFVLGVLGKEFALVLPALVLVLEIAPFPRLDGRPHSWRRTALVSLLFFGVAAGFFALRRAVLGASVLSFKSFASGIVDTAALSLSILAHYVYKLVFPFVLNAESEVAAPSGFLNIHTIAGLVVVTGIACAVYRWRRRGEVVFAATVFLIGLAPVLNIIPVTEVSAERFLYFPSLGFTLALALLAVEGMRRWRIPVIVALGLLLVAYSVRTYVRTLDWRDESTLFHTTVAAARENTRAHLNLGNVHYRAGRYQEAIAEYQKAIDLDPNNAAAWSGSAGAYKALGDLDRAFTCMQRALAIDPGNAGFYDSFGILLVQRHQYADAAAAFRSAIAVNPALDRARFNLGLALYLQDDLEGAIREFDALPHKDTDFVMAYYYLADAESRLGHADRASGYASTFLSLYKKEDDYYRKARTLFSGAGP